MKLLIVDDSAKTRNAIKAICASLTTDIHEASDGNAAIRVCAEESPDLVLMDIKMKPMNGIAATRQIHQLWPKVKVVIVTNHDDEETRSAAQEAGAWHFISKDNLADLPSLLSKNLDSRKRT